MNINTNLLNGEKGLKFDLNVYTFSVFIHRHKKVAGYYAIPSEPVECSSVRLSVRPSISASFPDTNLSIF